MSSISTKANVRAIVFLKIELTSTTLRYATENVMATDIDIGGEYFWEGRIASIGNLTAGFNDFRESSSTVSNVGITLLNGKADSTQSTLDSLLSTYYWGLKTVTIYLKQDDRITNIPVTRYSTGWHVGAFSYAGANKSIGADSTVTSSEASWTISSSDIIFKGVVGFPNIYTQNEQEVSFVAYDQRYSDQFLAAPNLFALGDVETGSTYKDLGQNVETKNVPIVYGDFSDNEQLATFTVGGSASSVKRLKVADSATLASGQSALTSITALSIDGIRRTATSTSYSIGECTLDDILTISSKAITVSCKGKTRGTAIASLFGGSSSSLLEHPIEILYDLLSNRLGIADTFIATANFTTIYNADTLVKCRRWIGSQETIVEVINDLCFEFGYELYSLFGTFNVKQFSVTGTSEKSFTLDDVREGSYGVSIDPNKSYFNSLGLKFRQNYLNNNFEKLSLLKDYPKIAQHGKTFDVPLELKWIHQELWAVERFGLLLWLFSQPISVLNIALEATAWDISPTDVFSLTYHIFSAQTFLTRQVTKDLTDFKTDIVAWNLGTLQMKLWAADADVDPTTYATALAKTYGLWHAETLIITGFNDTIKVTTNTSATATLTAGFYTTPDLLAIHIQDQINAAVGTNVFVTYNSTTRKFTIASIDLSVFTIHLTDTPEIGRSTLGFDVSSNKTGANSYVSDYLCIFDVTSGEAVSQWV